MSQSFLLLMGGGAGRDAGLASIANQMVRLGVVTSPQDELFVHDGCGLSRRNLVSTSTFVRVLVAMLQRTAHPEDFASLLPVNCQSGTLKDRLCALRPGSVKAKTGTMTSVSALSGYLYGDDSAALGVFSIICNNSELSTPSREAIIDDVVRLVSAFLRRWSRSLIV